MNWQKNSTFRKADMIAQHPEYIIMDIETTGLYPDKGDRIIEIAAVKWAEGKIKEEFQTFVNPRRALSLEAQRINNITQVMVKDAPIADEVLPKIIEFVGGGCIVGHNIRFDLNFMSYELALFGRKFRDETPTVDTLKMARYLIPHFKTYRLSYLAQYFGLPMGETHRALVDVKLTADLFNRLREIAGEQNIFSASEYVKLFGVEKPKFALQQAEQGSLF
ncbi:MAG: 3'-5' exonuclease [Candidatus Omnitrophica bacterium]|nr:3'-5' exonuclease [Candidatus Omnitrophota bacterium]